jgi:hypothetical protein
MGLKTFWSYGLMSEPKKTSRIPLSRLRTSRARGVTLRVNITALDFNRATAAAKQHKQTVPQWIRDLVNMSLKP